MVNKTQEEWLKAFDDINEEIRLWQALSDLLTWVAFNGAGDDEVTRNFAGAMQILSTGIDDITTRQGKLMVEYRNWCSQNT